MALVAERDLLREPELATAVGDEPYLGIVPLPEPGRAAGSPGWGVGPEGLEAAVRACLPAGAVGAFPAIEGARRRPRGLATASLEALLRLEGRGDLRRAWELASGSGARAALVGVQVLGGEEGQDLDPGLLRRLEATVRGTLRGDDRLYHASAGTLAAVLVGADASAAAAAHARLRQALAGPCATEANARGLQLAVGMRVSPIG